MSALPKPNKQPAALVTAQIHDPTEKHADVNFAVARRLYQYMRRYPVLQWIVMATAIALAALNSAIPAIFTESIRWTIEKPGELFARTGLSAQTGIIIGAGILIATALLYYGVMRLRISLNNTQAEHVLFDLRMDIFRKIQALHIQYFDKTKLGRILSRATSDVAAVRSAIIEVLYRVIIHGLMMVFLLGIMLVYDWVLALLLLLYAPLLYFANNYMNKRIAARYRTLQESLSRLTANISESVDGVRVTQAFTREDRNAQLFHNLCLAHRKHSLRAAHWSGIYVPLFDFWSQVVVATILGVGVWRIEHGNMTIADLIGFLVCTGGFFISVNVLADLTDTTLRAMAGGQRIFELLDTPIEINDSPEPRAIPALPDGDLVRGARVTFEHVTFGYSGDVQVLRDVSFEAAPGTTVALVGQTGAGKTSIVNLICRFYAHQSGRILIDGIDTRELSLDALHEQIGLVLQENFLFAGTVMDNIRFGEPDATDEDVREACAALDILDVLEDRLPLGLLTNVGERGGNLSAGQIQLVCCARAMLKNPRILLLDEATSAIDTFTEHRLQRALEKLMEGRTAIVVAHRLSTIRRADLILMMERGQIIERGPHESLMQSRGQYAALYEEFVRIAEEAGKRGGE